MRVRGKANFVGCLRVDGLTVETGGAVFTPGPGNVTVDWDPLGSVPFGWRVRLQIAENVYDETRETAGAVITADFLNAEAETGFNWTITIYELDTCGQAFNVYGNNGTF